MGNFAKAILSVLGFVFNHASFSFIVPSASAACSKSVSVMNLNKGKNNLIHDTRILHPNAAGSYPVLTFLHGFALDIEVYDGILCDAAEDNIVILFQMKFRALNEGLDEDAKSITPYLHDADQGILPRIGNEILSGFSYTHVGLGGHSRGGGVLAHAYSGKILDDGDYSSVTFIDPVVMNAQTDLPNAIRLTKTKVRTLYFNDPKSICVTHGWPDTISNSIDAKDIHVEDAPECKHMDVVTSWGSILPLCHSGNGAECKAKAIATLASAGFGEASVATV